MKQANTALFALALDLENSAQDISRYALYDDEKNNYTLEDLQSYIDRSKTIIFKIMKEFEKIRGY